VRKEKIKRKRESDRMRGMERGMGRKKIQK